MEESQRKGVGESETAKNEVYSGLSRSFQLKRKKNMKKIILKPNWLYM